MQVRVSKSADYRYVPRQGFAALPWNQCESVRPLAVDSDKADRLLLCTECANNISRNFGVRKKAKNTYIARLLDINIWF